MIAIEFLTGRLTIRDTIFGVGLWSRTQVTADADSERRE